MLDAHGNVIDYGSHGYAQCTNRVFLEAKTLKEILIAIVSHNYSLNKVLLVIFQETTQVLIYKS